MSTSPFNATVVARRDVSDHALILWVQPDTGTTAPFAPGQFVQLGWPKERKPDDPPERIRYVKRSYSIASAPHESNAYELFLALVPSGALTPTLWTLQPGDRVWCDDAPKGFFTLDRIPRGKDLVFLATGTGSAPFVSMLRAHRGNPPWRRVFVVQGARYAADLAYDAEMREIDAVDERMRYAPVVSREPGTWNGLHGRVHVALERCEELGGFALDPAEAHVLLCGNPDMIADVRARLEPRGFEVDTAKKPGTLHFEKYW